MRGCVVCSTADEKDGNKLDVRGLCLQCRDAYALGRKEALGEALRAALRVRGTRRSGHEVDVGDENADGSYGASTALVKFARKLLTRKYPPRLKTAS